MGNSFRSVIVAGDGKVLMINFLPENDGVDHVNIYSAGKTKLGRAMSNFAYADVDLGFDGRFKSIEGYWYWLGTSHPDRDVLRSLIGAKAKRTGQALRAGYEVEVPDFMERIEQAIREKVAKYTLLQRMLMENELPFTHYYVFSNGFQKDAGHAWLCDLADTMSKELRTGSFVRPIRRTCRSER